MPETTSENVSFERRSNAAWIRVNRSDKLNALNRKTVEQGAGEKAGLFGLCFATDDMQEGTRAFLEKRKPDFTGR